MIKKGAEPQPLVYTVAQTWPRIEPACKIVQSFRIDASV